MFENLFTVFISFCSEFFLVFSGCLLLLFYSLGSDFQIISNSSFGVLKKTVLLSNSSKMITMLVFLLCLNLWSYDYFESGLFFHGGLFNDYASFICRFFIFIFYVLFYFGLAKFFVRYSIYAFEFNLLLIFVGASVLFLISSFDFLSVYLCLEFQALILYVLAAFKRDSAFSTEAGLKYFIIGAFASGLLLFGISLIYGFTGSTNFEELSRLYSIGFMHGNIYLGVVIGLVFILVSFFFKLIAAPSHLWAVDVYEGSPTISVVFFSTIPKIGLVVCLLRILFECFYIFGEFWQVVVLVTSLLSLVVGSLGAVFQKKVKRFLVFSSITHVGFIFFALSTGSFQGIQGLFIYLLLYLCITLYVWSSLVAVQNNVDRISSVKYLNEVQYFIKDNFLFSLGFSLVLFSIAGIPPLAGFFMKLQVFLAGVQDEIYFSLLLFVVFSVISSFYYLRVLKVLFFNDLYESSLYWSRPMYKIYITKELALVLSLLLFIVLFVFFNPKLLYMVSYKLSLSFYV